MGQSWIVQRELGQIDGLSRADVHRKIIEQLLLNREVKQPQEFLQPPGIDARFHHQVGALLGDDLVEAVRAIRAAIDERRSIVVHGDYDVDGVSATAILWETIYFELGYQRCWPFIPHRVDHGYGLTTESVDSILKELTQRGAEPGLLITVDTGITGKDAVSYAADLGFSVIVTDHHTRPQKVEDLPPALAILHTHDLCGAGIAWVLARALVEGPGYAHGVDLVALATLADLQPLTGYNRPLVKEGLDQLTSTRRPGLLALYEAAGIRGKVVGTYEVGWLIAPRLNATGRLEHALDAVRLLVTRNSAQAQELATQLNRLNSSRQQLTEQVVSQAVGQVEKEWSGTSPIIVAHADWHEGVIGLAAAKLVEKYRVPAMVVAMGREVAKGSARSINGVNIVDLLREHESLMQSVGGHAMAAGFSLSVDQVRKLKERVQVINLFERYDLSTTGQIKVDLEIQPEWVDWSLYKQLELLEPHGIGNSRPLFLSRGVGIDNLQTVGSGKHLKFTLTTGLSAIAFNRGQDLERLRERPVVDLVYSIHADGYRGGQNLQLKIKDIR